MAARGAGSRGIFTIAGRGSKNHGKDGAGADWSHLSNQSATTLPLLSATGPVRDGCTLTTVTTESDQDRPVPTVAADDPRAVAATKAVQAGDLATLESLLAADPWLARARIGDAKGYRTLLHAATDWPGHFPNGPAVVERLVAAGAGVNAHSQFSSHTETPLHWAASSDDVLALDALLDAGADIEAPGAVLGGRLPMHADSELGGCPAAFERGARTRLNAAALGL